MKFINAITGIAVGFAKWCGITAAVVMTILVFMQVLYRYVLEDSLSFSEELARYMFIWSVGMGSALALRTRSHIGVEIIVERLPKYLAYPAKVVVSVINLLFFAALIWYGADMTLATMDQESPALALPMGYVYLSVPLSAIVLFICEIKNTMDDFLGNKSNVESVSGGE